MLRPQDPALGQKEFKIVGDGDTVMFSIFWSLSGIIVNVNEFEGKAGIRTWGDSIITLSRRLIIKKLVYFTNTYTLILLIFVG